jgi:hypothetical protein
MNERLIGVFLGVDDAQSTVPEHHLSIRCPQPIRIWATVSDLRRHSFKRRRRRRFAPPG